LILIPIILLPVFAFDYRSRKRWEAFLALIFIQNTRELKSFHLKRENKTSENELKETIEIL